MSNDRTSEFFSLARSLPADGRVAAPASGSIKTDTKNPAYAELRSFHQTASGISKDIAATSALLSELTNLVRHQSVFDDSEKNARVNNLVVRIKTSIENLNSRLDQAAVSIAQQKRRLGKNSQAGQEAFNVVEGLKTEFAEAASGFKDILQQRTDTMKESDLMQKQVYGNSGHDEDDDNPIPNLSLAPPPVFDLGSNNANSFPTLDLTSGMMPAGEPTASTPSYLPRPHGIASAGGGSDFYNHGMRNRRSSSQEGQPHYAGAYSSFGAENDNEMAPLTPFDIEQMEAANGMQSMQLIPDQDYLQQRADAMSTVESNIVELGTIFNKLAVMVKEHGEMVQRVEDNVEDANTNINLSLNVLTDTLTSLRTNRRLALRVFSALVVFILMFIIFFA
eukprot:scaffold34940_cov246-Amphora_coffeaeformis.AAC.5